MKVLIRHRAQIMSALLTMCLLLTPFTAFAKKGDKNYKQGLDYEAAQKWEQAAQEFALAVAADPSRVEFQLHYKRALFEASQSYMVRGRELAERKDFLGAYNAYRQAFGYDPINEVAASEMEHMLRLQREKTGEPAPEGEKDANGNPTARGEGSAADLALPPSAATQQRVISYAPGTDLKQTIKSLAEQIGLTVLFDPQTFRTARTTELMNTRGITVAEALDLIFMQEGLFFQRVRRNVILVADQNRRSQYQQLAIKTFYFKNADPEKVKAQLQSMIPQSPGRPIPSIMSNPTTNSLTIRDTPENLKVFDKIIQGIDKDRAEVMMDVRIYEITRSDLLTLGNNLGTTLGQSSGVSLLTGSRSVAERAVGTAIPTALGAGLILPASTLTALQQKDRTKLIFQTQLHAFDNEESTADIGQKVPVQTASIPNYGYNPTGTTGTGGIGGVGGVGGVGGIGNTGANPGVFGSYGYPVIQYTDVGLKLKFKPQIFPNRDVQVTMNITSSSLASAGGSADGQNLTPAFNQRVITGMARIPNNRPMMVANIAQDQEVRGSKGLPLVGLIPVVGRLFVTPTRNNIQSDIVLVVTPHVLRAPDITPSDLEARPSGTTQSPTSESLAQVLEQDAREEYLASLNAARRQNAKQAKSAPASSPAANETAAVSQPAAKDDAPAYVPAPKILINDVNAKTGDQTPSPAANTAQTAQPIEVAETKTPLPPLDLAAAAPSAQLAVVGGTHQSGIGKRLTLSLALQTDTPLALAMLKLRLDPRVVAVRGVVPGTMQGAQAAAARLTHSTTPAGDVLISVSPGANGALGGEGVIVSIELETLQNGLSEIAFDESSVHLIAVDGHEVPVKITPGRVIVK